MNEAPQGGPALSLAVTLGSHTGRECPSPLPPRLFAVRSIIVEQGALVHVDEGPFDRYLAELVLADIGVDASIPRGIGRVPVVRARIIPAEEADID